MHSAHAHSQHINTGAYSVQSVDAHILIAEDDLSLREAVADTLELSGFTVTKCDSAEAAMIVLDKKNTIDLIISDVNMGTLSGHDLLKYVKKNHAHIPVVLVTAYASINDSVEAMKHGAVDYLVKPLDSKTLTALVQKVIGQGGDNTDEPVACSAHSQQLLQLATRVAQSDSTAMIIGESGTGKEVLARYVHQKSPRVDKPFVAINCAAIPESMLEAILFGYEKGAYTGATQATPGKFEQANGGTILLDEISEMDISLQAKLLRVLQEREVERLGGRKSIKLDVRVIATSNRDMRKEVTEGKFREDLYFRLSVLPLQWAPLRDRKEDIIPLAERLLVKHASKQHRKGVCFDASTQQLLTQYSWPGNVRELDNVIQRALILQAGATIYPSDLGLQIEQTFSQKPTLIESMTLDMSATPITSAQSNTDLHPHSYPHNHAHLIDAQQAPSSEAAYIASAALQQNLPITHNTSSQVGLGEDLRKKEFEIIVQTLRETRGSKKNTAQKLGISPRTLRYKLAKFKAEGFELPV